jgi:divalent metal cation (Fe/Co/Zn/Cd) transporter
VLYGLLAGALLIGLAGNAIGGLWWADPAAALVIAAFAWRAADDRLTAQASPRAP